MSTSGQPAKGLPWRTKHKHIQAYGSETTNLTLPVMGLFKTVLGQAIIQECLLNLLLLGHHEWTILHDVLVERLSRDQDEIGATL